MMMHPAAIRTMRDVVSDLMNPEKVVTDAYSRWAETKI